MPLAPSDGLSVAEVRNRPRVAGGLVRELWERATQRVPRSRERMLFCRDIRRGEIGYTPPDNVEGLGAGARMATTVRLFERWGFDIELTAWLSSPEPYLSRVPIGTSDRAEEQADDFERWLESLRRELLDFDELVGTLVQYGECGLLALPEGAALDSVRDWDGGRGWPGGEAGRREWAANRTRMLAQNPPFHVEVLNPLDCVPILVRGRRGYEARGLVVRKLYDVEELARDYRWPSMGDTEKLQRAFDANRAGYGCEGMVYLYAAYLMDREMKPYAIYSAGGEDTWRIDRRSSGYDGASVIDFEAEYGVTERLWDYQWGLGFRDDPDFMGMPALYPMATSLLNAESLLSDYLAHTKEEAFGGHLLRVDPEVLANAPKNWLTSGPRFKTFRKPGTGEIAIAPGAITPFNQATVSPDARYMVSQFLSQMREAEDKSGTEASSGHQVVVEQELRKAGKIQIRRGAANAVAFVGSRIAMLADLWLLRKHEIRLPAYVTTDDPATLEGASETQGVLEFTDRWTRGNYWCRAKYPEEGNLAEISLELDMWAKGASTFENVRKKCGDTAWFTTWIKVQAEKVINSPEYQAYIGQLVAERRGDVKRRKMDALRAMGDVTGRLPTAAISPEAAGTQQALGPGGQMGMPGAAGPPVAGVGPPGTAAEVRGGIVSGQVAQAARMSDAASTAQIGVGP